jgi:cbb3-type cytochrome c oxidase subunit III
VRFSRVVNILQYVTLALCVVTVVMLFLYDPAPATVRTQGPGGEAMTPAEQGAEIFAVRCSGCHGADGKGGYGPALAGAELLEHFPDAADQIAFVTEGTGTMPGFGTQLEPDQIAAVVAYTREVLAGEATPPATEAVDPDQAALGAQVYADTCDGCHGADGEGGFGPQLAGGAAVSKYPDPADQIAVVTDGRGAMPAYDGDLTPEEIAAVVAYTRSLP